MAKVSWPDRKRIKRTFQDAFDPRMADKFPARTQVLATGGEPVCPPGVDFGILNIQCELLPYHDRAEFAAFCRYAQGEAIKDIAGAYNMSRYDLYRAIDCMLNWTIKRMKEGTAEMLLSIYWEMHKEDDYSIVDTNDFSEKPSNPLDRESERER